jgi:hypothetical protein
MAVRYLQRAAECAVYDLQTGISQSTLVAKQELVLAIYELGICFRHGWGVSRIFMSLHYFSNQHLTKVVFFVFVLVRPTGTQKYCNGCILF